MGEVSQAYLWNITLRYKIKSEWEDENEGMKERRMCKNRKRTKNKRKRNAGTKNEEM